MILTAEKCVKLKKLGIKQSSSLVWYTNGYVDKFSSYKLRNTDLPCKYQAASFMEEEIEKASGLSSDELIAKLESGDIKIETINERI